MDAYLILDTTTGRRWFFVPEMNILFHPVQEDGECTIFLSSLEQEKMQGCPHEIAEMQIDDDTVHFIVGNDFARHDAKREMEMYLQSRIDAGQEGQPAISGEAFTARLEKIRSKCDRKRESIVARTFREFMGTKGLH